MKQYSIMFLLLLPLLFFSCDDDEELWENSPVPAAVNCRLDFYDSDGNDYEITSGIRHRITLEARNCEDEDAQWADFGDYNGNSLYAGVVYWSNHPLDHFDNIVLTISIGSKQLFGDDEMREITVVCDGTREWWKFDEGCVKSVSSNDLTISCPMKFEKDEYVDDWFLPINVALE